MRGKWILENLLGTPPPPPLPNVPPLRATDTSGVVLPMRQRMERHRSNPVCASCHAMMDPLGLSLENFDAVGRWRTLGESSAPIDASGMAPDGTRFDGPDGLRSTLLRSDRFVSTLTEKMLTYALGRGLEYYDAPSVRAILRGAAQDDYRFSSADCRDRAECAVSHEESGRTLGSGSRLGPRFESQSQSREPTRIIMFITKKALPRRTFLRGVGATLGASAARRDGAGVVGAGADSGEPGQAARLRLSAERRRAELHRHQLLDADRRGNRIRVVANSESAGAVSRIGCSSSADWHSIRPTHSTMAPMATTRAERARG